MKITFDPKHNIMRIQFREGRYGVSKEVDEGIIIDKTKDNKVMAIEILDASQRIPKKEIKEITVGVSG